MQVKVEIQGLEKLTAALRDYPRIAEPIIQRALEASAFEVQKNAVKGVVPWKTGMLTQSFGLGVVIGRLVATIRPTADYAYYVHEGTGIYGPHATPVVPKTKKALFWKGADHPVRSVKGQKPNRFMPKIVEKAQDMVNKHFLAAQNAIAAEIAKRSK